MTDPRFSRRGSLAKLGAAIVAAAGGRVFTAGDAEGGNLAVESGVVSCVLTPELTEGPYYIAGEKVRRDITEGKPGTRLMLHLVVVNVATCKPIKGAAVDIWHADAAGDYSGFSDDASSRTYMRGIQRTDANGLAIFKTVYPGWYPGRTVHIHVKVHAGGRVVHTGQLFFNDAVTDKVFAAAPYKARGPRTTRNTQDSIFINGGRRGMLTIQKGANGYRGTFAMGVHK